MFFNNFVFLASYEHHTGYLTECTKDMDFQISSSTYSTRWNIPNNLTSIVKDVTWSLQKMDTISEYADCYNAETNNYVTKYDFDNNSYSYAFQCILNNIC